MSASVIPPIQPVPTPTFPTTVDVKLTFTALDQIDYDYFTDMQSEVGIKADLTDFASDMGFKLTKINDVVI